MDNANTQVPPPEQNDTNNNAASTENHHECFNESGSGDLFKPRPHFLLHTEIDYLPNEIPSKVPPKQPYLIIKLAIDILLFIIKSVIIIYDIVTLPYYYISMDVAGKRKRLEQTPFSRQDEPHKPESPWRQQVGEDPAQSEMEETIDAFKNFPEMMCHALKRHSTKFCYGYRELVSEYYVPKPGFGGSSTTQSTSNSDNKDTSNDQPPQSQAKRYQRQVIQSSYKWFRYTEFEAQISGAAKGFLLEGIKAGDKVMIYADTRAEWQITLHALLRINAVVCTMYATLGYDGIVHSVNETEVTHIITQADKVKKLLNAKKDLPTLKKVIFFEQMLRMPRAMGGIGYYRAEELYHLKKHPFQGNFPIAPDVECVSFSFVLMRGHHLSDTDELVVKNKEIIADKDSVAVIMYTSGSTGQPKGVLLTHRNIMATIKSFYHVTRDFVRDPGNNVGCAYLPLAHIFEFCLESMMLYTGVRFGFANPQTLTNISPGVKPGYLGDTVALKPTVIIMVPLVLDRIVSGVKAGIKARGYLREQLVSYLLEYKSRWTKAHYDTPLVNRLVCRKITATLGSRLRFIICGSAPLSASTQTFIRSAFNVKLPQGFGTTETCSATTCQIFDDMTTDNVGPPVSGCAIKLEKWEEAGYSPTDLPNPRGEIVVGSESIAQGYYKLDQLTKESFYEESGVRWYRTGDIGEFLPNGNLRIIDRKKDLVKLQNGEYISLGKVESTLKSNTYTDNICVYADSFHNYVVAIASVNETAIIAIARNLFITFNNSRTFQQDFVQNNKISNTFMLSRINELRAIVESINDDSSAEERHECVKKLCANESVVNVVYRDILEKAKERNLNAIEIPAKIALVPEEWTEDLNLVTAAMKIRRNFIYKRYQSLLNQLYKS